MDERTARVEKLERLRELGVDPYPHEFRRSHTIAEALAAYHADGDAGPVRLAGRLTAVRRMGKASFARIEDQDSSIQIYLTLDKTQEFTQFKELVDRGDVLGVEGPLFVTRTGEVTVETRRFDLLAKALQPMPEKFHGLKDVETMRRRRYLHLIADQEARTLFQKRSRIFAAVRAFLEGRGFLDVQTPVLQPIYGGAAARPFVTRHNELKRDLYLRVAPELYLKRLIVGGFERVYEMAAVFRNEGIDSTHNPEYTLLEVYQAYADYTDMMELTESLVRHAAQEANGTLELPPRTIGGREIVIDVGKPWRRLPFFEALREYAGADLAPDASRDEAAAAAEATGIPAADLDGLDAARIIGEIFDRRVEERLIEPTFVLDYPAALCPLTKRRRGEPLLAERFEPYVAGFELGNAFSELTDPGYQRSQFLAQGRAAEAGDEEAHPMDEDYLNALEHGLPPTGGLGIGMDRLVMLLTGASNIRDIIFFPLQRRLPGDRQGEDSEG